MTGVYTRATNLLILLAHTNVVVDVMIEWNLAIKSSFFTIFKRLPLQDWLPLTCTGLCTFIPVTRHFICLKVLPECSAEQTEQSRLSKFIWNGFCHQSFFCICSCLACRWIKMFVKTKWFLEFLLKIYSCKWNSDGIRCCWCANIGTYH